MAYKTGRSRTLTASATISGSISANYVYEVSSVGRDATWGVGAFGLVASAGVAAVVPPGELDPNAKTRSWGVSAGDGYHQNSAQNVIWTPPPPPMGGGTIDRASYNYTLDISGTVTISVPVEEWMEVTTLSDPSTGIIDAPPRLGLRFYEAPVPGSTATITASSGGATASYSAPASEISSPIDYSCGVNVSAGANGGASQSVSATMTAAGVALGGTGSVSGFGGSATVGGGAAASCSCSGAGSSAAASAALYGSPPKAFSLDGTIFAVDQAYSGSVNLVCSKYLGDPSPGLVAGPNFSASASQQRTGYSVEVSASNAGSSPPSGSVSDSGSIDQWQPVTVTVDPAWCAANGEYVGSGTDRVFDTAVNLHGYTFGGATLTPAASLALGTGTAASLSFSPAKNLSGYRYLRVHVSVSAGSHPFAVQIGSKTWNQGVDPADHTRRIPLVAVAAGTDFDIDLCDPDNDSSLVDLMDTRWPVADPGVGGGAADGPLWGVTYCTGITLTGLDTGVTYTLGAVSQVRQTECKLHVLGSWRPRFDSDMLTESPTATSGSDTTTEVKCRRFLVADTDGRQSLEYRDVSVSKVTGGSSGTVTYIPFYYPISSTVEPSSDAAYPAGQYPGWSASVSAPAPDGSSNLHDGYLNSNAPAGWLWGGGLLYSGGWSTGVGLDAAGGIALPAQQLFHSIEWYPGIGDVFGGGGSGGALVLHGEKIFRAQAHGLVLLDTHAPATGKTVTLLESGATVGTDMEHAPEGTYRTSGLGLHGYSAGSESSGVVSVDTRTATQTFLTRHLSRVALRTAALMAAGNALAVDSPRGWLHLGHGKGVATYSGGTGAMAFLSPDYAVDSWLQFAVDPRRGALYLLGKSGSSVKVFSSADGGNSASGMTGTGDLTMTADTAAITGLSERGLVLLLTADTSGSVSYRQSKDSGATWSTSAGCTVSASGSSSPLMAKVLALDYDPRRDAVELLAVQGTSTVVFESVDAGETWVLKLS